MTSTQTNTATRTAVDQAPREPTKVQKVGRFMKKHALTFMVGVASGVGLSALAARWSSPKVEEPTVSAAEVDEFHM